MINPESHIMGTILECKGRNLVFAKKFFVSPLDVGDKMILNIITKLYDGFAEPDMR